jgi:glycerol uptake facilitator-like aquaporin
MAITVMLSHGSVTSRSGDIGIGSLGGQFLWQYLPISTIGPIAGAVCAAFFYDAVCSEKCHPGGGE